MMINWNMQNNSNLLFKVFTMTKFIFTQLYDLLISTNSVKLYLLRMLKEQCVVILHLSIQKSLVEYYPNHFQRCLNPEKQLNSITPLFIWSLVNGIMSRLPSVSALRKHVSLTSYMPKFDVHAKDCQLLKNVLSSVVFWCFMLGRLFRV